MFRSTKSVSTSAAAGIAWPTGHLETHRFSKALAHPALEGMEAVAGHVLRLPLSLGRVPRSRPGAVAGEARETDAGSQFSFSLGLSP